MLLSDRDLRLEIKAGQELAEQISTYKKTGSYKTKKGSANDQKISYNYFEAS